MSTTMRIRDVASVERLAEPASSDRSWLLNLDVIEKDTGRIREKVYVESDRLCGSIVPFSKASVLYSKLRPNLNKVVLPDEDGFATTELLPLKVNSSLIRREYLAVYLRSQRFVSYAVNAVAGAKMPRISRTAVLDAPIPIPDLAMQDEIVSELNAVCGNLQSLTDLSDVLDELVKSRFVEMFGDGEYPEFELGSRLKTSSGGTPSRKHPEYFDDGDIPWLTSGEVNKGTITKPENFITSLGLENSSAKLTPANTVVVAMYGATAGQVGIVEYETTTNQAVCCIAPMEGFEPIFLRFALESKKAWMIDQCSGGAQPNISQGVVKRALIPDVPIALQREFADFVQQVDKSKVAVQKAIKKLELLKASLMQEYFG